MYANSGHRSTLYIVIPHSLVSLSLLAHVTTEAATGSPSPLERMRLRGTCTDSEMTEGLGIAGVRRSLVFDPLRLHNPGRLQAEIRRSNNGSTA
jgi:hypothetical protein